MRSVFFKGFGFVFSFAICLTLVFYGFGGEKFDNRGLVREKGSSIDETIKTFAEKIKSFLKPGEKVQFAHFVEQGDFNGGANLDKPIIIALQKYMGDLEAKKRQDYKYVISGKIFLDDKKPALIIRPEVMDRDTRKPADFPLTDLDILDYKDILTVRAPTSFDLRPRDKNDREYEPEVMKRKVQKVIAEGNSQSGSGGGSGTGGNPMPQVSPFVLEEDGKWVRPYKGCLYKVQILVGDSPEEVSPRKIIVRNGELWVEIEKNEIYQVKVANEDNDEIGVRLLLDGIDQFHFMKERDSKGDPAYSYRIIGGKFETPFTIQGWLIDNENLKSFKVTDLPEAAISQTGAARSLGSVGIISVNFHDCIVPGSRGAKSSINGATGFGPPVKQTTVKVERSFEKNPMAGVSIRYSLQSGGNP